MAFEIGNHKDIKMYFMRFLLLVLLFLISSAAFSQASVDNTSFRLMLKTLLDHSVPEVEALEEYTERECLLLDAREKVEYDISHIENSVWVGYDDFDLSRVSTENKEDEIIVYCSVGYRSEKIAEKLIAEGYKNVSNMYGGIFEWGNRGFPVENDTGSTNKIHPYDNIWGLWLKKELRAER